METHLAAPTRTAALVIGCTLLISTSISRAEEPGKSLGRVAVIRTPHGGIQPQAVTDAKGTIHLLYFGGEPAAGDLFYARRASGQAGFSEPIQVNSQDGSAIAVGTIRGGQIALGRGGRVHVVWNGSREAGRKTPSGGAGMLYARLNAEGTAFEPQRNLMTKTSGLDGGGTVAADGGGNVYVAWHARTADSVDGEMGRRMWVAHSIDDGATFAAEAPAFAQQTGACACCGTRALADRRGEVYILYRAATGGVERDIYLLTSASRGENWKGSSLQPWRTNSCPMSSEALIESSSGVLAAWETLGQVFFARIDPKTGTAATPVAPPGKSSVRKHPSLAVDAKGAILLAWAEDTGWQQGGSLVWQVFDPSGRPTAQKGRIRGGIPVWGLPAAVALPEGGFMIFH